MLFGAVSSGLLYWLWEGSNKQIIAWRAGNRSLSFSPQTPLMKDPGTTRGPSISTGWWPSRRLLIWVQPAALSKTTLFLWTSCDSCVFILGPLVFHVNASMMTERRVRISRPILRAAQVVSSSQKTGKKNSLAVVKAAKPSADGSLADYWNMRFGTGYSALRCIAGLFFFCHRGER